MSGINVPEAAVSGIKNCVHIPTESAYFNSFGFAETNYPEYYSEFTDPCDVVAPITVGTRGGANEILKVPPDAQ